MKSPKETVYDLIIKGFSDKTIINELQKKYGMPKSEAIRTLEYANKDIERYQKEDLERYQSSQNFVSRITGIRR